MADNITDEQAAQEHNGTQANLTADNKNDLAAGGKQAAETLNGLPEKANPEFTVSYLLSLWEELKPQESKQYLAAAVSAVFALSWLIAVLATKLFYEPGVSYSYNADILKYIFLEIGDGNYKALFILLWGAAALVWSVFYLFKYFMEYKEQYQGSWSLFNWIFRSMVIVATIYMSVCGLVPEWTESWGDYSVVLPNGRFAIGDGYILFNAMSLILPLFLGYFAYILLKTKSFYHSVSATAVVVLVTAYASLIASKLVILAVGLAIILFGLKFIFKDMARGTTTISGYKCHVCGDIVPSGGRCSCGRVSF
jgi:heme/copper-type cytochrome/quinol oxidase subunit 4